MCKTRIFMAPLQGFTDAAMRHFHKVVYGGVDEYFTPFVRMEHGAVRARDLRDVTSPLNENHSPTPQIIVRDGEELEFLTERLVKEGHRRVDINMGCPFVPQMRKGRGAGVLRNVEGMHDIAVRMEKWSEVNFSIKMRLGIDRADEWRRVLPIINAMPVEHVAVHPRTAVEQYAGELHIDEFERFMGECRHRVVFNGEINEMRDIEEIVARFDGIYGVMIGRGLLRRPSLAAEWASQSEWDRVNRVKCLLDLHERLLQYAETHLCGEHQVIGKLLPYWEYFGDEFAKKGVKRVLKAKTMDKYKQAVGLLE